MEAIFIEPIFCVENYVKGYRYEKSPEKSDRGIIKRVIGRP